MTGEQQTRLANSAGMNTQPQSCVSNEFIYRRLDDEQLTGYRDNGFLRLGRVLTEGGLETMREQCMSAWRAEKGEFDPTETWLQNALLNDINHRADIVRRFCFHGPLLDVAEQLVGLNIKGATSQLTFKMRGNTRPFGWHQDNGYGELDPYNSLTTLTALDDMDEENDCLWIIPASHQRGQLAAGLSVQDKQAETSIDLDVDESKAIPVVMKAGEAIVFHCWTLHKSEGNRSPDRDRRILFLRYADANAVEVYNDSKPRLGRLLRGRTRFEQVEDYEAELRVRAGVTGEEPDELPR